MLSVISNDVTLTCGDTAVIAVSVSGYEISASDTIRLVVGTAVKGGSVTQAVLKKTAVYNAVEGKAKFHISPADTENLIAGDYYYDVVLYSAGDNSVHTIIGVGTLPQKHWHFLPQVAGREDEEDGSDE